MAIEKIIAIAKPESSPVKRMAREAKDNGKYIDMTQGKKTRSVIMTEGNEKEIVLIGASIQSTTIVSRMRKMEIDRHRWQMTQNGEFVRGEGSSE